jgi:hypothetical protein
MYSPSLYICSSTTNSGRESSFCDSTVSLSIHVSATNLLSLAPTTHTQTGAQRRNLMRLFQMSNLAQPFRRVMTAPRTLRASKQKQIMHIRMCGNESNSVCRIILQHLSFVLYLRVHLIIMLFIFVFVCKNMLRILKIGKID